MNVEEIKRLYRTRVEVRGNRKKSVSTCITGVTGDERGGDVRE